jgi:hypothetical protein
VLFSGIWSATGTGVRFTDVRPDDAFDRALWATATWRRISDPG